MTKLHVGCCGWGRLRQPAYFESFDVLEVQKTFYEPPRIEVLTRWREQAPAGFEFTLKAWQLITHEPSSPTYRRLKAPVLADARSRYGSFRPTDEVWEAWRMTLACTRALRAQVLVFQCPASFTPTDEHVSDMRTFFVRAREDTEDLVFGWEPRGDWSDVLVRKLCEDLRLVHVVDPFVRPPLTDGLRYLRLHGVGGFKHTYTDEELEYIAGFCRDETYVMFNNIPMARDARRFIDRWSRGANSPPA